jgi:hypothetical protein
MSEQAAAAALAKLAANPEDFNARNKVVRWLLKEDFIRARVDTSDLERLVDKAARDSAGAEEAAISRLKSDLQASPGTTLVALFRHPAGDQLWQFGPVRFGPVHLILDNQLQPAAGSWGAPADSAAFAFRIDQDAIGVRGSERALEWLRAALGALYLAGRIMQSADARLGPIPADELAPAMFVGPASDLRSVVDVMRLPSTIPLDADRLLSSDEAAAMVGDCLQLEPSDLVQRRLRQAVPWIQCSFDALSFADAVLSLGVALEALIGSEGTSDVVRTIGMRAAFLLREGRNPEERTLSASDWRSTATRLYQSRSVVAHGRYEIGADSNAEETKIRQQFEEIVCQVAAKFRAEGRKHGWLRDADLKRWQENLELG